MPSRPRTGSTSNPDHTRSQKAICEGLGIAPEEQPVAERGEEADRVEVAEPDRLQVGGASAQDRRV